MVLVLVNNINPSLFGIIKQDWFKSKTFRLSAVENIVTFVLHFALP